MRVNFLLIYNNMSKLQLYNVCILCKSTLFTDYNYDNAAVSPLNVKQVNFTIKQCVKELSINTSLTLHFFRIFYILIKL